MKVRRVVMYPGFMSSSDAHAFKETLGVHLVYRDRAYRAQPGDFIIGWGNSKEPNWADSVIRNRNPVVNHWTAIANAVDKRVSLTILRDAGVSCIPFTTSKYTAETWWIGGHTIVCRTELRGMKGAGIVITTPKQQLPTAPLYTQFQSGCDEFRVHVAFGKVINFQQKKRKNGVKVDQYVRSEENGWVFCRKGVTLPDVVGKEAIKAVKALGLDFGACDVLYYLPTNKPMILEVNTSPGLDFGYGIEAYTEAFQRSISQE